MPEVLNISSDEEEGLEEAAKEADFDWIKELLFASDGESDDDVIIVGEKKPELKSKSSTTLAVKDDDDDEDGDDDDCVVLEGDPDNGVTSVDEDSTGSDDLLVVGEKGQVACRDYPHARHLCAKYPFSSTPHERHCDQCHCYVCDSLAPCPNWGSGKLSSDHCHANDTTEVWKLQRKNFKLGLSSPLPASTNYGTAVHVVYPQRNLRRENIHLPSNSMRRYQGSRSKNQVSRSINIPVCPTTTNLTVTNGVTIINGVITNGANHGRSKQLGSTLVRRRVQPIPVPNPNQLLGVRSHAIQKGRGSGGSSLGSQFLRPHVISKRVGSSRDLTMNDASRGSSGFNTQVIAAQQHYKYPTASGFSNHRNRNGAGSINSSIYSHPSSGPASLSCANLHTMTAETQAYGQPLPQSNDSQGQSWIPVNDAPSSYVPCLDKNQHGNMKQSQATTQPKSWIPVNDAPSSYVPCLDKNQHGNMKQSQATTQPKPCEESRSGTAGNFSAVDLGWTENTSQSIEPVIDFSSQQSSGSVEPPTESSHLSSSIADIESWLFDKDLFPMVTEGVFPSELNIPSPDLDPVDTGMLSSQLW